MFPNKFVTIVILASLIGAISCSGVPHVHAVPAPIAYHHAIPYNIPPYADRVDYHSKVLSVPAVHAVPAVAHADYPVAHAHAVPAVAHAAVPAVAHAGISVAHAHAVPAAVAHAGYPVAHAHAVPAAVAHAGYPVEHAAVPAHLGYAGLAPALAYGHPAGYAYGHPVVGAPVWKR